MTFKLQMTTRQTLRFVQDMCARCQMMISSLKQLIKLIGYSPVLRRRSLCGADSLQCGYTRSQKSTMTITLAQRKLRKPVPKLYPEQVDQV